MAFSIWCSSRAPDARGLWFSAAFACSTRSRREEKPGGAQLREFHGLAVGSLYICACAVRWLYNQEGKGSVRTMSTASSVRSEDSYRRKYTRIAPVRLQAENVRIVRNEERACNI